MRLWTIHPRFLDAKGLVALWREALLAQAVLSGRTKGYTRHPQLIRFAACKDPRGAIGSYLHAVFIESTRRGYRFDQDKIVRINETIVITATRAQARYEFAHLLKKLQVRDRETFTAIRGKRLRLHPLFTAVAGGLASWERP